jgi:RNA polymerase sigma factor (sigma-70 family)
MSRDGVRGPRHRLIEMVAWQMHRRVGDQTGLTVSDLYDMGVPGLATAQAEWDGRGQFEPFALQRIRWAIVDGLRKRRRDPLAMAMAAAELAAEQLPRTLADIRGAALDLREAAEECIDEVIDVAGANLAIDIEGAERVEDDVNRLRLRRAISELPPPQDEVMERYVYRGETFEDVGKAVGLTAAAVCKMHARALHALRLRLGDPLTESPSGAEQLPAAG